MKLPAFSVLGKFHLGPAVRVSLGLSSLIVAFLLVMDLTFGLFPDQTRLLRQLRERISENLAVQTAVLMESGDNKALATTFQQALDRDPQILSLAVRRDDGQITAQAGEHPHHWAGPGAGQSTIDSVRVPLLMGKQHWGDIEIRFQPAAPQTVWQWLRHPDVFLVVVLGLGGFVLFSIYLRRVLQYLDPGSVIPDRVRVAFDAFSEGVMVVDPAGRIMLANAAFRSWTANESGSLYGRPVQQIPSLKAALPNDPKHTPWMRAMLQRSPSKGEYLEFAQAGGESIKAVVNCSPIQDGHGKVRGCIVTFDNVTELDRINTQLVAAVADLEKSQAQIEQQNEKLQVLAMSDPLTGCLNRRAFFEKMDALFTAARDENRSLCCIMTDIDHFKLFNDRYGHAIGDQVLKAVSKSLVAGLRDDDLLCRYGGEEFCIIMPNVNLEQACSIAERLRSAIENRAGMGVRSTQSVKVTSSFGVAALGPQTKDHEELILQADKALYAAKNDGRNCVKTLQAQMATAQTETAAGPNIRATDSRFILAS